MSDKGGGDGSKKQQQHTTSPNTQHDKPTDQPLQQQVKRPRYESTQWKLLPSQPQQQQQRHSQMAIITSTESTPSPTNNPQLQITQPTTHSSSSPTPSSPSGQETNKSAERLQSQTHSQFRKGKYVSPVWKPIEMLWLAKAWRVQYQGGGSDVDTSSTNSDLLLSIPSKGKTRAEKDREVAEFLKLHGVNRDAKTAGTKWDNMLGEFRKVYEWEKGSEREQVGKSYFRLSPYERKNHRLPASFDEEVYNELSQFMGFRLRTPQTRGTPSSSLALITTSTKSLPTPPSIKEDETSLSAGRVKQLANYSANEGISHGNRGNLFSGFESSADVLMAPSSSSSTRDALRRIGRIRMTWEESISLWAEEGEYHRGRVKLEGLSFLNADEVTFLDDTMVGCTMEAFEDGPLKGFSIDKFTYGQQVKVFGRRKSTSTSSGFTERIQLPLTEPSIKSIPPWEYQDPTEYYMGCLRVSPTTLPSLIELTWHLQEQPPEDSRFPLRKDVYRDLPQGKELFFTTSNELLDCRAITFDILSPIVRSNPSISSSTASSRDSFIGLWDDCINRIVSKFCSQEIVFIRKPSSTSDIGTLQDQWPNVTGFVRNLCLWRGEESDQTREGNLDPSSSIAEKILWTYMDLPYILGYYAIGYLVTFCALCRSQDRVVRTDLYTVDLSTPTGRLKALVPCWRIASLLPLLAEHLSNYNKNNNLVPYSDFEVLDVGGGNRIEFTPNVTTRIFSSKRKWIAIKEIYDFLDDRIPHVEKIFEASEKELSLVFKPRGFNSKPTSCEELVEALKFVTKALVALHDVSFMHRDLGWDKVMKRCDRENEWFVTGFDEAVGAPQIYPHGEMVGSRHAPEMGRGLHGVKVDVWGVGQLLKTCGLVGVPKLLRELQKMCLDQNPELRPTAADCYHHLLQLQSSLSAASGGY